MPTLERVGQDDRRFDRAQLVDLRRAGQLAEGVADEDRAGHLVLKHVAAVRQDRGHPGPDAIAFDDRRVSDAHAVDVGDRIARAARVDADDDAEVSRARPRLCRLRPRRPRAPRPTTMDAARMDTAFMPSAPPAAPSSDPAAS